MSLQADREHRRAQARLADATGERLAALIAALPDPEAENAIELFAPQAARVVSGGQERAARFAIAYVSKLSPPTRARTPASVTRALEGVVVDQSSPVARSPILRLKALLADGEDELEARRASASYANGLASGDLQAAERGGLTEGARAGARRVVGWRKSLAPNACSWCQTIASGGGRYRAPETVPFHQRDECGVAPVFEDEEGR